MSIISPLRGRFIRAISCTALLSLAASSLCAQTVIPNTDPGSDEGEFVNYVGHYGEVLKLRGGWEIRASMQGEAEVINHYPGYRFISADLTEPFNPKPEDFLPENFSRDRLIQLVILPWSASASKSLEALKPQKIADLKSSGVEFRIIDDPWLGYGSWNQRWPKGTFEVFIATPYRLSQLYTTSGAHLVIFTSGRDTPPSTVITSHSDRLRMSLRDWVAPESGDQDPKTYGPVPARNIPGKGISLRMFAKPRIWMTWLAVSGAACLILGILGVMKRWDPLRRASLSLLIFSNAGALIGGLVGLCFWPFAWSSPHLPIPSAVACLFMPLLAWLVGRVRGRRPRRLAMIGTAAWALAASAIFVYISLVLNTETDNTPYIPAYTAIFAFVFYAIGGVVFGFLDSIASGSGGGRALLALTLMLFTSRTIWAQSGPVLIGKSTPNPIELDARQRLAKHGLDRDSFREQATEKLKQTQVIYKYQRVEIKGIFAKDLTDKAIPDLFDLELGGSHLGDKGNDVTIPPWVQEAWNGVKDLKDLHADAYGEFSEAAKQAVKALEGQEVNEIVAHSWGTEIVYNAILAGKINPPRRLIVCGMPDRDKEKWLTLSRHTGTEVVVYPNSSDPIAGAARLGGALLDGLAAAGQAGDLGEPPTPRAAQFEAEWEAACRQRPCNEHARKPKSPKFINAYKGRSHDRLLYYKTMLKDKTIPLDESDAYALRDRQEARIVAEADRLYAAAVNREVEHLRPESKKVKADADFLSAWQGAADSISRKTQAAQALQEAEKAARLEETRKAAQPREATRAEMDSLAAKCGYELIDDRRWERNPQNTGFEQVGGENTLGFKDDYAHHYFSRYWTRIDLGDLELAFLIKRVCQEIERNPGISAPRSCNESSRILQARGNRADFEAKLDYLFGEKRLRSPCATSIIDNRHRITDSASFDRVVAEYQAPIKKEWLRQRKESKRAREESEREEKRRQRGERQSGGNSGGQFQGPNHDEVWDRLTPIFRR